MQEASLFNGNGHITTAQQHVNYGRAYLCGWFNLYACAVGSNQQLGYLYNWSLITLNEDPAGSGYYEVGPFPE